MKKIVLAAALVALSSGVAHAATATGSATATVVAPITIAHTAGATLNFGTFVAGSTAGSVTVTSGGSGSVSVVATVSGNVYSADAFTVGGDSGRSFNITTAAGTLTGPGASTMAFTTTPSAATGTLSTAATPSASFTVGGTLTVGASQAAGTYTGSYVATVVYQ